MSTDALEQNTNESPDEVQSAETAADPEAQLAAITAERDQLTAEKAELYDRLLRRQADLENFRRRAQKEKDEIREFAGMDAVGQILPILDDFERALTVECADPEYRKGMLLIYQRLFETFQKLGLELISTEGQKFDPYIHHVVESTETDEAEDHTILAELQKGYNFRGKLLRPSMVKVAVAPSTDEH